MAEKTTRDSLEYFCRGIIDVYGARYLRTPTWDDLQKIYEVIPDAYVTKCYSYTPVNNCYNIYAAGQIWKVETDKINDNYVFTKGCPKLFHDLAIEDDDILLLMKTDSNIFELKIYRRGVEVVLTNKEESEDDSLLEIPKETYYKNVQSTLCDDDDLIDQMISEIHEGSSKEWVNKNIAGKEKSKVNEKRKRYGHELKILDVERKVVARTNSVEKSGKYEFTIKGENRMRMPANVVRFAGFRNKVHELKVTNMNGKTIDMNLRHQKNGDGVRYAIEAWPMFMKENGLRFGDTLHFTFVSSGNLLILSHVDGVNAG
ncbi:B3 domain-containing protein At4g34400-like [Helianthus annuus]|uniref:B3 domain-containing protein At4g34400-like n=1 Tax=Helianthus annuus TaxID=4232 RepID=UPI000B8FDCD3|nr:B3 domain-containing protein At4g34400-like [Helianthus annuus]